MKLLKNLFLILTLTSVLVSCGNDDDVHVPTNSEKIIGKWELNEYKADGKETTTVGSQDPIEATISVNGKTFTDTFSKFTHPNTVESSGNFVLVTTTIIGESTEEVEKSLPFNFSGSWKITGDKLTIKNDNVENIYDIVSLTDKVLKLKNTSEEIANIGNTSVTTTLTSNLSFEKQ